MAYNPSVDGEAMYGYFDFQQAVILKCVHIGGQYHVSSERA